jgi:hypothetical protein
MTKKKGHHKLADNGLEANQNAYKKTDKIENRLKALKGILFSQPNQTKDLWQKSLYNIN